MDSLSETPAVFLYSEKEEIFLPIWIGANEAVAIQAELSGVKSPRPLTNDLLKDVIEKLDARSKNCHNKSTGRHVLFSVVCQVQRTALWRSMRAPAMLWAWPSASNARSGS